MASIRRISESVLDFQFDSLKLEPLCQEELSSQAKCNNYPSGNVFETNLHSTPIGWATVGLPLPPSSSFDFSDSWSYRASLNTSFGYTPSHKQDGQVTPPTPPTRPLPHGLQPAPPAPPQPEWMQSNDPDMQQDMDMDSSSDGYPPSAPVPAVTWTNVVSTVSLGCKIDLKLLLSRAKNATWRPTKFPAVVLKRSEPNKCTCLVFASGKCVVTGPKSIDKAKKASRGFVMQMQKMGFNAQWSGFKVVNLSGMFDCGFPLKLDKLSQHWKGKCKYDANRYPGLTYKLLSADKKCTMTVFRTGKVVLVGAKGEKQAIKAASEVFPVLVNFRKA